MRHIVTIVEGLDIPVSLHQQTNDTYNVTYGAHVRNNLTYEGAAHELGECILHSLACAGKVLMPDAE